MLFSCSCGLQEKEETEEGKNYLSLSVAFGAVLLYSLIKVSWFIADEGWTKGRGLQRVNGGRNRHIEDKAPAHFKTTHISI